MPVIPVTTCPKTHKFAYRPKAAARGAGKAYDYCCTTTGNKPYAQRLESCGGGYTKCVKPPCRDYFLLPVMPVIPVTTCPKTHKFAYRPKAADRGGKAYDYCCTTTG